MADLSSNVSISDLKNIISGTAPEPEAVEVKDDAVAQPESTEAEPEADGAEPEKTDPEPEPETKPEPTQKPHEKRFSALTKRAQEAEAKAAELERKLAEAAAKPAEAPKPAAPVSNDGEPTAPDEENFTGTWEELKAARAKYTRDLAAHAAHQAVSADRAETARIAAEAKATEQNAKFNAKLSDGYEKYEDLEGAIKAVSPIVAGLGLGVVVQQSETPVELIRALNEPELLGRLAQHQKNGDLASAARELFYAEFKVKQSLEAAAAPKPAKTLPTPPKVVGGRAEGSTKGFDAQQASVTDLKRFLKIQ